MNFLNSIRILGISNHNSFRVMFDKIASVYFIEKYINILALEWPAQGTSYFASCICTLSFPVVNSAGMLNWASFWRQLGWDFHTVLATLPRMEY